MSDRSPTTRIAWAAGAAGAGLAALVGGAWLLRSPLLEAAIRSVAASEGLTAELRAAEVGFSQITLERVRILADGRTEASAEKLSLRLRWSWSGPALAGVAADAPTLALRLDEHGVSSRLLAAIAHRLPAAKGPPKPLQPLDVDASHGAIEVATPLGTARGAFDVHGVLTQDLTADLSLAPTTLAEGERRIEGLSLAGSARTVDGTLVADLDARASKIRLAGWSADAVTIKGAALVPPETNGVSATLRALADAVDAGPVKIASARADLAADPLGGGKWRLSGGAEAASMAATGVGQAEAPQLSFTSSGDLGRLSGEALTRAPKATAFGVDAANAQAQVRFTLDDVLKPGRALRAALALDLPHAKVRDPGAIARLVPTLDGVPGGTLLKGARGALTAGLADVTAAAQADLEWRAGAGRLVLAQPLTLSLAGGRKAVISAEAGKPALSLALPSGAIEGAPTIALSGDGMPPLTLALASLSIKDGAVTAAGTATLAPWRAGKDSLSLGAAPFSAELKGESGAVRFEGAPILTGDGGAMSVAALQAPLKLAARWDAASYDIRSEAGCIPVAATSLKLAGHAFDRPRFSACPEAGGVLAGKRADGAGFGGFRIDKPALAGRLEGKDGGRPVRVSADAISGRMLGAGEDLRFEAAATGLDYRLDAEGRSIEIAADALSAHTAHGKHGAVWIGAIGPARYLDPSLGAKIDAVEGRFIADPADKAAPLRLEAVSAAAADEKPANAAADWRPRFNPVRLKDLSATLVDGRLEGAGAAFLADGDRRLGAVTFRHRLDTGAGSAALADDALVFSDKLDLYEITELARGVVELVKGPVGYRIGADWNPSGVKLTAAFEPKGVSFATRSLGPVEGVEGRVVFDDFAKLTTPPGQTLRVAKINPGVLVEDGVIAIRMLGPEKMAIESAVWPFAGGQLSVAPTDFPLGSPEFTLSLALKGVDAKQFFEELEFKDLTATGTIEGVFPLVFTKDRGGEIKGGKLHAAPSGGTISYTGAAGQGLKGMAAVAFQALRSFRYDRLELELNGRLDGDIVTGIAFTGENQAPLKDLPVPAVIPLGLANLDATGLDFKFKVSVRAPFRDLMRGYASTQDARPIVEEAIGAGVDGEPPKK